MPVGSLICLAHGCGRRHGRANAEGARLVARRGNHAPLGPVADSDRTATKLGIIALFDRRIEGVHVDVDDLAHRHTLNHTKSRTERELRLVIQYRRWPCAHTDRTPWGSLLPVPGARERKWRARETAQADEPAFRISAGYSNRNSSLAAAAANAPVIPTTTDTQRSAPAFPNFSQMSGRYMELVSAGRS